MAKRPIQRPAARQLALTAKLAGQAAASRARIDWGKP